VTRERDARVLALRDGIKDVRLGRARGDHQAMRVSLRASWDAMASESVLLSLTLFVARAESVLGVLARCSLASRHAEALRSVSRRCDAERPSAQPREPHKLL
jgi:hypothetical protein